MGALGKLLESKFGIVLLVFLVSGAGGVFTLLGVNTGANIAAEKEAELTNTFHKLGVVSGTFVVSSTLTSATVTVSPSE